MRPFCEWLVAEGHLEQDPTFRLRQVKEPRRAPRALPAEAVARVLAAAPDARARAILWLQVGCGLRCIEVSGLDVADYDPVKLTLFVRGRSANERIIPVPETVAEALDAYVAGTGPLIRSTGQRARR